MSRILASSSAAQVRQRSGSAILRAGADLTLTSAPVSRCSGARPRSRRQPRTRSRPDRPRITTCVRCMGPAARVRRGARQPARLGGCAGWRPHARRHRASLASRRVPPRARLCCDRASAHCRTSHACAPHRIHAHVRAHCVSLAQPARARMCVYALGAHTANTNRQTSSAALTARAHDIHTLCCKTVIEESSLRPQSHPASPSSHTLDLAERCPSSATSPGPP